MEDSALRHLVARDQVSEGVLTGIISKTDDFIASTLVDTGVALFNSVVDLPSFFLPESLEPDTSDIKLDTYDILNRFNEDYANFFEENRGSVETASFIAGIIVPGGLALKGMKLLRAGRTAFYPEALTTRRGLKDIAHLNRMLKQSQQYTPEFRSLRRGIYKRLAAGELIENVALEAAILGVLSDHPLMEDYMKDPWTNFAIWAGVGGVIGTSLGAIVKNATISNRLKRTYTQAQQIVTDPSLIKNVNIPSLPAVELATRSFYNAKILAGIAEGTQYDQLTRDYAARFALSYEAKAQRELFDILSPEIKNVKGLNKEQKAAFIERTQDLLKTDGMHGADTVGFMGQLTVTPTTLGRKGIPEASESLLSELTERFGNAVRYTANSMQLAKWLPDYKKLVEALHGKAAKRGKEAVTNTFVGYSPVFKAFVPRSVAWTMQTASDLGEKLQHINIFTANKDASDIFLRQGKVGNPAIAGKRYVDALHSASQVNVERLPKHIYINTADLPAMNAWVSLADDMIEAGVEPTFHITTGSRGVKSTQLNIGELANHLVQEKQRRIKDLTNSGASVHEMATRLDMDVELVEAFIKDQVPLASFSGWRKTTDLANAINYLSPDNRMLKLGVSPKKGNFKAGHNPSDMASNLDQIAMDQFSHQHIAEAVAKNGSVAARAVHAALARKEELFAILRMRIGEISQESVGNLFATSVDQGLRRLDDLGAIISQVSKDVYNVANKTFEETASNLSALTRQVNGNEVYRQEFAEIVNALAGIPGYRFMNDAGEFWVRESVLNAEGAVVRGKFNERRITTSTGETLTSKHQVVRDWMEAMQTTGRESLNLNNTLRAIEGNNPLNDIGLWIPSFNPVNKFISYIIDPAAPIGRQVRLLVGNDRNHLAGLEKTWKQGEGKNNTVLKLITKDEQADFNAIKNRVDPISMDYADISLRHSGASKQAITPDAGELLATVMENMHHRLLSGSKKLMAAYNADIMHQLDMMSLVNQRGASTATLKGTTKNISTPKDSARSIKRILLGDSPGDEYTTWQTFNNSVKTLLEKGLDTTTKLFERHIEFDNLGAMRKKDYVKLSQDMEDAGIATPFTDYDNYLGARAMDSGMDTLYAQHLKGKLEGRRSNADTVIAASNAIVATLALRIADIAHPIVNALSLPILTNLNLVGKMPETFLGVKGTKEQQGGIKFAARVMYDGVRARFDPKLRWVVKEFEAEGFITPTVSEATEVLRLVHSGDSNAAAKINKILDSGLVKKLSIAADTVEVETRAVSLMTGYVAAKRAYPGITHEGAKIFAKQFMDRAIGNYYSFQRPAMFQGTFGVAIGLFQTYMLSMAQGIYRGIEGRQFKALAAGMLTQAGMFGMSSLPFYDLVSKAIGENFSDNHFDLTTGTYRALPDPLAEFILYGLPSNIGSLIGPVTGIDSLTKAKGVALYTRGDLQPRLPFLSSNPAEQIVAVNALMKLYSAAAHTKDKIIDADGGLQIGQALAEGLSMQNLSRPVARGAELISGYSVNQQGNTVQGPEDIWTVAGISARVLTSRTTEEQVKRFADHLNSYYGSIDHANRKRAVESVKTAVRGGNLSNETLGRVATEYMRTGTPQGWQAALNEAIAGTEGGIDYKFTKILKPSSPINLMIQDL